MSNTAQVNCQTQKVQPKRRIRNLLIDRRFQLRWVVNIILVVTLIVSAMGYFLYRTVADATDQMVAEKLGDLELTEASIQAFVHQAEIDKSVTIFILVAWLVALVVFLSGATIVLTHKVAGPVYKMRKIFRSMNDDNLHLLERLRKGDELREAFDDFDDMLRRWREQRRIDLESMEKIRAAVNDGRDLKQPIADLDALIEKYRNSVQTHPSSSKNPL